MGLIKDLQICISCVSMKVENVFNCLRDLFVLFSSGFRTIDAGHWLWHSTSGKLCTMPVKCF